MADTNVVKNWGLKVMQQKITEGKGCMLNCALNGRKNPDGTYPKSMYINVWIDGKCECEPDDYTGKYIEVDGRFTTGDYISKKTGETVLTFTIFATEVRTHIWTNN